MRNLFLLALLIVATPILGQSPSRKLDLAVLYAGVPESPRAALWRSFLEDHGARVGAIVLSTLSKKTTKGFDVVIVDGPSPFLHGAFEVPPLPELDESYDRPTVLVGPVGGRAILPLKIKLDWL